MKERLEIVVDLFITEKKIVVGEKLIILIGSILQRIHELLMNMNLFDEYSRDVHIIYRQRIITRCLFSLSLCLYNCSCRLQFLFCAFKNHYS